MRRTDLLESDVGRRSSFARLLAGFLMVLLTVYVLGLALGDPKTFSPFFDGWLCILTQFTAVALCVTACIRTRFARLQVVLATGAVTAFAVSDTYYISSLNDAGMLATVSLADVGYLTFYPLMLGALAVVVAQKVKDLLWPLVLDGIVGALAAASLMALILAPVLTPGTEGTTLERVVAVLYPLLDLLLITAVCGVLSTRGLDIGPRWSWLILGLLLFSASDVAFALDAEQYTVGSLSDAGWTVGLVAIAAWVDGVASSSRAPRRRTHPIPNLAAPLVSTAAALSVLVVASQVRIPLLAVVFAASALALAVVPLAFRHRMLVVLAQTDELTGLPNRRALFTDIPVRLRDGREGALFLLDLDRFKHVNDALGHDVGDALLVQVGKRFSRQLRGVDLLVRLGGDEFAVFLDRATEEEAVEAARRLQAVLSEPVKVGSAVLQMSASIGIALSPRDGADVGLLMRKADIAMFRAKTERTGHHVYTRSDDDDGELRLRTIQELRQAINANQFELHYQPKVRLADGVVTGVEALVRWNHPTRGQLSPQVFLPLAEEAGLMPELSALVLGRAVRRAATWRREGLDLTLAVNLSASCILPSLPADVVRLLELNGVPASCLMLEITEDILMSAPEATAAILTQLRAGGVRVSIDDFGTGYSSLAYLRDLPVDELKLDRAFIVAMHEDIRARGLVGSIIDLGHSLGLRVVAEGVDDALMLEELRNRGCDEGQGFYLSVPLPANDLAPWIAGATVTALR